jgi:hypothetical protein
MTEQVKESYSKTLHRAEMRVQSQISYLVEIADALNLVGNKNLGCRLIGIADLLEIALADLRDGHAHAVNSHFAAANDGTTNMVNACLAILSIKDRTVVDHQSDGEASAAVSEADGPHA